jgi:FlgD Ig-like domain
MFGARWVLPGRAAGILLLASASLVPFATPSHAAGIQLGGVQDTLVVAPGATFTVDVAIRSAGASFNGFDLGLRFDPSQLTFVPTAPLSDQRGVMMTGACPNTFHVFTPSPDSLSVALVLLCNEISVTGPGSIYRVQFTAGPTDAWTQLTFGSSTQFYLGGPIVIPLDARPIRVKIGSPPNVGVDPNPVIMLTLTPPGPNPAHSAARLSFSLPRSGPVSLTVFDLAGRRVRELASGTLAAGDHERSWDLADPQGVPVADGLYLVRLTAAGGVRTRRLVVAR